MSGMASPEALIRVVQFRLSDGWYAVDIMRVAEVIRPTDLHRLPRMPSYVAGSMVVRGAMVPVIDLRLRFRQPSEPLGRRARIMLLTLPGQRIGVLVDEVSGVTTVAPDQILPPPPLMDPEVSVFLIGVATIAHRLVSLVNIDRLVSPSEQAVLGAMNQEDMSRIVEGVS